VGDATFSEDAVEAARPFVISNADDARALSALANLPMHRAPPGIEVAVTGLPASERARWNARLNFWVRACGCHTGALFALVAVVVCIVTLRGATERVWSTLVLDFGLVVAAALAGKVVGIVTARLLLAVDVRRLARRISAVAEDR
jgi:hypothetical protein